MITLHHLENSQSFRIIWLLEELNVPYELKVYKRNKKTMLAPEEYKALHPAGTAPIITDDEIALAETNAIVDYILDKYSEEGQRLRPAQGDKNRVPYLYWFHAGQGSLMPMLLMVFIFNSMTEKTPFLMRPLIRRVTQTAATFFPMPRIKKLLGYMNDQLEENQFLAGNELTAADIVTSFELLTINRLKLFNFQRDFPNIADYVARVEAIESYKKALAKSEAL
ncbi:MAG: glutathione S-transferase [Pasteurella sp.]|nr:glutathione S-transferase [Pasteurella sp.]